MHSAIKLTPQRFLFSFVTSTILTTAHGQITVETTRLRVRPTAPETMRTFILAAVLVVGLARALLPLAERSIEEAEHGPEFLQWASEHQLSYGTQDVQSRFTQWKQNRAFINAHNAEVAQGKHTYTMGMNQFGAMSNGEYRNTVLGLGPPKQPTQGNKPLLRPIRLVLTYSASVCHFPHHLSR